MLIGVAWFLKLAFDRNWIGPPIRILVGLACAAGLVAWSERFRRRGFAAFSYSLKALGTGIAYLSLWAAFSVFHLASAGLIFAAMTAVTVANAVLAWRQDSELLALYALAGGFATPALLSEGHGSEIFLFSYLALLNAGALLLLALHPWKRLALGALLGTAAYYFGWTVSQSYATHIPVTLFFLAVFFAAFAAMPFLILRQASAPASTDPFVQISFPILNAAATFLALMVLFADQHSGRPWAVLALADRLPAAGGSLPRPGCGCAGSNPSWSRDPVSHGCHPAAIRWLCSDPLLAGRSAGDRCAGRGRLARSHAPLRRHGAGAGLLGPSGGLDRRAAASLGGGRQHALCHQFDRRRGLCRGYPPEPRLRARLESGLTWPAFPPSHSASPCWLRSAWRFTITGFVERASFTTIAGATDTLQQRSVDAGFSYSAWCMLYGAALMTVGFLRRSAFLRWQALIVLALSIGMVFLNGIGSESQGYRVLTFLALGVLLLGVSFAYQKDWLRLRS